MFIYSKTFKAFLDAWPGKKTFGIYRFMPVFFLLGAALEFSMINWHVGEINFCECLQIFVFRSQANLIHTSNIKFIF